MGALSTGSSETVVTESDRGCGTSTTDAEAERMGAFVLRTLQRRLPHTIEDTDLWVLLCSHTFSFTTPAYPRRQPVIHIVVIRGTYKSDEFCIS